MQGHLSPLDQYVIDDGGCWMWQGPIKHDGYGLVHIDGRRVLAHRVAYEWACGSVPPGFDVHHQCGQRLCVNPAHLEALTHAEHTARHNPSWSHCSRGHSMDDAYYPPVGDRQCRECRRQRQSKRAARITAARALAPPRPSLPSRHDRTPQLREEAKELRAAGLTYQQIADELGASETSARRWCKHREGT